MLSSYVKEATGTSVLNQTAVNSGIALFLELLLKEVRKKSYLFLLLKEAHSVRATKCS